MEDSYEKEEITQNKAKELKRWEMLLKRIGDNKEDIGNLKYI